MSYCYEVREGKYLGHTDHVQVNLETAQGHVYALLPYKVLSMTAALQSQAKRGEDVVLHTQLITQGDVHPGQKDIHLIWVSVTDPQGRQILSLQRHVPVYAGQGDIHLPIAWDDPPGKWRVTLRDAATGVAVEVTYDLPSTE